MAKGWATRVAGLVLAVLAAATVGCSKKELREEKVAAVNGEAVTVGELREVLGLRGGIASAADIPVDRKREALDRLIAGRLLAQEARAKGLDNTDQFRAAAKRNETAVLVLAFLRKEMDARGRVPREEAEAEAKRMRGTDNSLSEESARARASRRLVELRLRKLEEELVTGALKEYPSSVDRATIDRIGKGQKTDDNAVLATAGGAPIRYGEMKELLSGMAAGAHPGSELLRNPEAIGQALQREIAGRALAAHAKKAGIEGSEWVKAAREEMERSVLIDVLARKSIFPGIAVTDREIADAYKQHADMLRRGGKTIPLDRIKEQIRGFLENEKRKAALLGYVDNLKKNAKIDINEKVLPEV